MFEAPIAAGALAGPGETIRVVSKRTGLSMEVLRAWERRFGFPKPERRPGSNRRLYSRADVERLLAIQRALKRGYRIGDVIAKSRVELEGLVGNAQDPGAAALGPFDETSSIDAQRLVRLLVRDDVTALEDDLRRCAATLGPRRFLTDIAHPFAIAVGEAWADGTLSIRHEHVATECLTTRLRPMLDAYQDMESRPQVVLATLPSEWHTLPLLMVALYLAVSGAKPRLIGGPTPVSEIVEATRMFDADIVGISVTPASERAETRRAIRTLVRSLPAGVSLWVGGGAAPELELAPDAALTLVSWQALDEALATWRRKAHRS